MYYSSDRLRPRYDYDREFEVVKMLCDKYIKGPERDKDLENSRYNHRTLSKIINKYSYNISDEVLRNVFEYRPRSIRDIRPECPNYRLMAETAIGAEPDLLRGIVDQWPELCKIAVKKYPASLKYVNRQTKDLCSIAMSANPSVYKLLLREFKTHEYLVAYSKEASNLSEVLNNIKNTTSGTTHTIDKSFGVEIEFVLKCDIDEVFYPLKEVVGIDIDLSEGYDDQIIPDNTVWRLHRDTTARDVYEVNSCILTDRSMDQLYKVMSVLSVLHKFGRISIDKRCGFHVHIDVSKLSFADVVRVVMFYRNNISVIQKLLSNSRSGNKYCAIPTSACLYDWLMAEHDLNRLPTRDIKKDRYYVVNPMSYFYYNTVEFRQHEATLHFNDVKHWIYLLSVIIDNRRSKQRCLFIDGFFDALDLPQDMRSFYKKKFLSKC